MKIQNLTNKELYALCKEYGKNARKWARKFGFLLPEVARRHMYRRYRCTSIFEFAAKLAGMSRDITSRILNLSEKLKDKPLIWEEFNKYGWTKLAVIADIVTIDTQEFWRDKLRKLPRPTLQEYLKTWNKNNTKADMTGSLFDLVAEENDRTAEYALQQPKTQRGPNLCYESQSVNMQNSINQNNTGFKSLRRLKFKVDAETEFEFKKFKQAMEKEKKESLTMGETLKLLLKKVKKLESSKSEMRIDNHDTTADDNSNNQTNSDKTASPKRSHHQPSLENRDHKHRQDRHYIKLIATAIRNKAISQIKKSGPVSRQIPQKIQKSIISVYSGRCAFYGCNEPYSELHHPDRFSLKNSHQRIYPLCRLHHQLAHAGLIKNEELTIENWEIDFEKKAAAAKNVFSLYRIIEKQKIDQIVRDHWQT